MHDPFKVLFLCTGNSARSILAESLLNRLGQGRFEAHSAGRTPTGRVNPHAIEVLREMGHDTSGLRSKSWLEYAGPGAPAFDFIFTVCDNAAGEACPVWPGRPMTAHWGLPDPAAVSGTSAEISLAFHQTAGMLRRRIEAFVSLPVQALDKLTLQAKLRDIGQMEGATGKAKADT